MKHFIFIPIILFLFYGCSIKMDSTFINPEILPNQNISVVEFLDSKTYNTYDEKKSKLTTYFFRKKDGKLTATNAIIFIPMESKDILYGPFSQVTSTINRLTNYKAKTIEETLSMEVKKNQFKKLFNTKDEYIIRNDFARDLRYSIQEFEEMIERRRDREDSGGEVIIPVS